MTRFKNFRQHFTTPREFPGRSVILSISSMSKVLSCQGDAERIWGIISDWNFNKDANRSTDVLHLKRYLESLKTHTRYIEKASFIEGLAVSVFCDTIAELT